MPWFRPWSSYTPTLTAASVNPNLGASGTAQGAYCIIGGTVQVKVRFAFSGSGAASGTGVYRVSLPPVAAPGGDVFLAAGEALIYDASANTSYVAVASLESTSTVGMRSHGATGEVGASAPMAFASGDQIRLNLQYRAA